MATTQWQRQWLMSTRKESETRKKAQSWWFFGFPQWFRQRLRFFSQPAAWVPDCGTTSSGCWWHQKRINHEDCMFVMFVAPIALVCCLYFHFCWYIWYSNNAWWYINRRILSASIRPCAGQSRHSLQVIPCDSHMLSGWFHPATQTTRSQSKGVPHT